MQKSSHHPTLTPYQPFPAQNQEFFNIAANNDAQFKALCETLNHPEWSADIRFSSNEQRTANRAALVDLISAETVKKPAAFWIDKLNAARVPCGGINTIQEALKHPQIEATQMIRNVQHSTLGNIKLIGPPVKTSSDPIQAPPTLGQHTDEVLSRFYSTSELDLLRREGVI